MARKPPIATPQVRSMALNRPRNEVESKLNELIAQYEAVAKREIRSEKDLDAAHAENRAIGEFVHDFLRGTYVDTQIATEFGTGSSGTFSMMDSGIQRRIMWLFEACQYNIDALRSLVRRLSLYQEPTPVAPVVAPVHTPRGSNVFIVHGHNSAIRESVARVIQKLGLPAIILHEQPSAGRTVIEKLEAHQESGFVVVLLTSDDLGCSVQSVGSADPIARTQLEPRARQNVLFEAGLFIGLLGRKFVCLLKEPGVAIPSDLAGYVWTEIDPAGGWQLSLARELREAGFEVDLNKL